MNAVAGGMINIDSMVPVQHKVYGSPLFCDSADSIDFAFLLQFARSLLILIRSESLDALGKKIAR